MGIERTLADRKGRDFCELPRETIASSNSRRNRRRQRKKPPVQKLFETCKLVFASAGTGFVPPHEDIDELQSVLGTIRCCFFFSFLFWFMIVSCVVGCYWLVFPHLGCLNFDLQ